MSEKIIEICGACGNDKGRLMDIVSGVTKELGCCSDDSIDLIASQVGCSRVEVEGVVSFYSFFNKEEKGNTIIRLCNDVVDKMKGFQEVSKAFEDALGVVAGQTTECGCVTFEHTPCIGMCDQAPAALVGDAIVTNLTADKAKEIVEKLKAGTAIETKVADNLLKTGEVIFAASDCDAGLKNALAKSPEEVITEIEASKLRGRGGAGFPTGLKWKFTREAKGDQKYILCNADEGEPGTFKDRVLLTKLANDLFAGMTIAGYAIGANQGVLYLRGEYAYLRDSIQKAIDFRKQKGLLGQNVAGKAGFNFDIRIQMGAGAYICGEESALISSCEGLRGDPKTRPPFPAEKGYNAKPTAVNNVETYISAARILEKGATWFAGIGTEASKGTKLLSISGDCEKPGVYEYAFGVTVKELLDAVGAKDTQAVLVGGPSGQFIAKGDFGRKICFSDLATGGSIVVFNSSRNMVEVAYEYMEFFVEESCGYCTPCRAGNVLLRNKLEDILAGKGQAKDLDDMLDICKTVKIASRCGLGQTSSNPVASTIKSFKASYDALVKTPEAGMNPTFNVKEALALAEELQGRKSEIYK